MDRQLLDEWNFKINPELGPEKVSAKKKYVWQDTSQLIFHWFELKFSFAGTQQFGFLLKTTSPSLFFKEHNTILLRYLIFKLAIFVCWYPKMIPALLSSLIMTVLSLNEWLFDKMPMIFADAPAAF